MDSDNTMASQLKRKRDPVEVLDSLKGASSAKKSKRRISVKVTEQEAALTPKKQANLDKRLNTEISLGKNGTLGSLGREDSKQSVLKISKEAAISVQKSEVKKSGGRVKKTAVEKVQKRIPEWKISSPIGGRMVDADPVFTADEK